MKITKKQYITYGSIAFILGTVTYLLIRRKQKQKMADDISKMISGDISDPNKGGGQTIIAKPEYDKLPDGKFPVKIGDKSKKIYAIQKMLNQKLGTNIDLDGKYGESTFTALCSKLWNSGTLSTYETSCIDHSLGGRTRRMITQTDYDKIMTGKF